MSTKLSRAVEGLAHRAWLAEQVKRLERGEISSIPLGSFTSSVWDEDGTAFCGDGDGSWKAIVAGGSVMSS